MTNLRALTLATLTLLVISAGPLAAQKATVRYNPGNRGEERTETGLIISSDTWKDGLQTRRAGRTGSRFNMKAEEVVRVDWDQAPSTYHGARYRRGGVAPHAQVARQGWVAREIEGGVEGAACAWSAARLDRVGLVSKGANE